MDKNALVPIVFGIIQCFNVDRLLGYSRGKGEFSCYGNVITICSRGSIVGCVKNSHRFLSRLAEFDNNVARAAFFDIRVTGSKIDQQGALRRRAIEGHLIQVIGLWTAGGKRAKCPTMNFSQCEAIVRRAITDLLAAHTFKGNLNLLPTAEIVLKID